jgi:putative tryptophan/tyrosine transport system substrate-binding protein
MHLTWRAVVLALSLTIAPLAAEAQPAGKVWRIGFLGLATAALYERQIEGLRRGLREHGYIEGRNVTIEFRWAEGQYDRLPALAAEIVRLNVDVIITHGTLGTLACKQATSTIPIVMAIVANPVEAGLVASLSRPSGNVTGSSFLYGDVNAKRVDLLKAAIPNLARVGVLVNPDNPPAVSLAMRGIEQISKQLNVKARPVEVRRLDALAAAFKVAGAEADAVVVTDEALFAGQGAAQRIADVAVESRVPAIGFTEFAEAGGLIGYGVDFPDIWRQSMTFVDKILKGAKPADLPIQQPTRFVLIINLKTAKALGLTIPPSLLLRADQVIDP